MSKPFVLSVKAVIQDEQGRYLLMRRASASKNNAAKEDFPGGKIDAGETFDQALIREIQEETGLRVELEKVVGTAQSELPDRIVAYLILRCRLLDGQLRLSSEHTQATWVTLLDLATVEICPQFHAFAVQYTRSGSTRSGSTRSGSTRHF